MPEPSSPVCSITAASCAACRGEMPRLLDTDLSQRAARLHGRWRVVNDHHLENGYRFDDFRRALIFTNAVGALAEAAGHHPEIRLAWGSVAIRLWTHRQDGLTDADFDLAADIERLATASFEIGARRPAPLDGGPVETGLDVLCAERFAPLLDRRVALVTNQTGRGRDGTTGIDLLFRANGVTLVSLLSPDHGIRGVLDSHVPATRDERTGLPVHSLHGAACRPTAAMLRSVDAIVIDVQDVGARFCNYTTTVACVLEEAAIHGLAVFVLDRPNPTGGLAVEGPALDQDLRNLVGYVPRMPVRHGMTIGELATLFNAENGIGAELTVIAMRHWRRAQWFDETRVPWIPPSPDIPSMHAATLYPGVAILEYCNLSVGRGTPSPFEQVGAPWIDGVATADLLNRRAVPGVRFHPVRFTPQSARYRREECGGVFMVVTDRDGLHPVRLGIEIAWAIDRLYGGAFDLDPAARLGSRESIGRIKRGDDPALIAASWADDESAFRTMRHRHLIY